MADSQENTPLTPLKTADLIGQVSGRDVSLPSKENPYFEFDAETEIAALRVLTIMGEGIDRSTLTLYYLLFTKEGMVRIHKELAEKSAFQSFLRKHADELRDAICSRHTDLILSGLGEPEEGRMAQIVRGARYAYLIDPITGFISALADVHPENVRVNVNDVPSHSRPLSMMAVYTKKAEIFKRLLKGGIKKAGLRVTDILRASPPPFPPVAPSVYANFDDSAELVAVLHETLDEATRTGFDPDSGFSITAHQVDRATQALEGIR